MTLREEVIKNSGILLEMPMKRVEHVNEIIRTPLGTFTIKNIFEELEVNNADYKGIYEYIEDSTILDWKDQLSYEFMTVYIGYDDDGNYIKKFSGEPAAKILDLIAEKLPVGIFDKGMKECEKILSQFKEDDELYAKEIKFYSTLLKRFKEKHNNNTRRY